MKKLLLLLSAVMAFASCDKYTEGEFCPICLESVSADRDTIALTVCVSESYLKLNYCEFGAVCSTNKTPSDMGARPDFLTSLGNGKYELKFGGDFSAPKYYIHLYTASHESGKARYHACIEVVMTGGPAVPELPCGDGFINLSANGTANCYIVNGSGKYKFRPVKGNSDETLDVKSVEVLWESFGTDETPEVGALIPYAEYRDLDQDGYFDIYLNATDRKGNAVIAAKDASGSILWSWHIWLTDQPVECVYANNAGTMMDRNLGATSATPGDVGALGLLYQWGRKDPFLGSSNISSPVDAMSTVTWPSAVSSDYNNGTIEYAVSHPLTFIIRNTKNDDWYYTGISSTDDTRWTSSSSAKSIYDPCPVGWRVPDGGDNGVWSKAVGASTWFDYTYDVTNEGMNLSGKFGAASIIWYPASSYRFDNDGALYHVGTYGYYWSASHIDIYAHIMKMVSDFMGENYIEPSTHTGRAIGCSVRCMKE
jgi:hypothetical protein